MTRRAVVGIALLLAVVSLAFPTLAGADGDPASDVLLGQNVFYPYTPPVAPAIRRALDARTAAAHRAGLPIKVALIAAPTDLGTVPSLFGQPQAYARFLDQEISFRGPQPLLVVMAAGYGVQGVDARARGAIGSLTPPAGRSSTDLARAARAAVAALASASGHPLQSSGSSSGGGHGGGTGRTVLLVALILAAVAVAAALVAVRARQSSAR